jgi:UPF0755 protein
VGEIVRMKKFSFLIVLLLLIVGGIAAWWVTVTAPVDISNKTMKHFVIKEGQGIREIANRLKTEGLINDSVSFFLLVKQLGLEGKIQAGEFYLSPSMNAANIARALQVGTFDTRVTIPEGKRAEEVADTLQKQLPSYQASWRAVLNHNEGYLFPDTYAFAKDATIESIVAKMRNNFTQKYQSIKKTNSTKLTQEELVIIASLVEREARFSEDRPLVASVILNRFAIGMALNIDATVQYASGTANEWWPKLTDSAKNIMPDSSYNTYTHPGLPPTPISNPGIESLIAVLEAPETDYLYYVSDKTGHNHYAKTLQEHNVNIEKYQVQ